MSFIFKAAARALTRAIGRASVRITRRAVTRAAEEAIERVVARYGRAIEEHVLKTSAEELSKLGFTTSSAREFIRNLATTIEESIARPELRAKLVALATKLSPYQRDLLKRAMTEYARQIARRLRLRVEAPLAVGTVAAGATVGYMYVTEPQRRIALDKTVQEAKRAVEEVLKSKLVKYMPEGAATSAASQLAEILGPVLASEIMGLMLYNPYYIPNPQEIARRVAEQVREIATTISAEVAKACESVMRSVRPETIQKIARQFHINPNNPLAAVNLAWRLVKLDRRIQREVEKLTQWLARRLHIESPEDLRELREAMETLFVQYLTSKYGNTLLNMMRVSAS